MINHIKHQIKQENIREIGVIVKGSMTIVHWFVCNQGWAAYTNYNTNDLIDVVIDGPNWIVEEWESKQ